MSHEIRTPMNAILGYADILRHSNNLTGERRQQIETVHQAGEHLLGLIGDVLDMSKVEAGRMDLHPQEVDLHALLPNLVDLFRLEVAAKKVDLTLTIDESVPAAGEVDGGKLRQILLNLIGNAVKFIEAGGVAVRVTGTAISANQCRLRVVVKDTGPGIADGEKAKVFRQFEQTESGRRSGKGTGLGLALSRDFARLMGGDIVFDSTEGVGSEFVADVLVKPLAPRQRTGDRRLPSALDPMQKGARVLVVDDSDANRALLFDLLTPLGLDLREARNGAEAVGLASAWQPQLVITDSNMPVMDGTQATEIIRERFGEDMVIICLSAGLDPTARERVIAAGANAYMSKPFRAPELFALIEDVTPLRFVYDV